MCARYWVDLEALSPSTRALFENFIADAKNGCVRIGEIAPGDKALVFTQDGAQLMAWGFTQEEGKRIFNARAETLETKPMFREHAVKHRCLVPASGFFEWKTTAAGKVKYGFRFKDRDMLMAGVYREEVDGPHYVIVTSDAVGEIANIHDRMPLVPGRDKAWLEGDGAAPMQRERRTDMDSVLLGEEQLSFLDY